MRDKTRPSRIPKLSAAKVTLVVRLTLDEPPPTDSTHWTVRAMAERSGVSTRLRGLLTAFPSGIGSIAC